MRRPWFTKLLESVPQTFALRSGVLVRSRGRADAKHFWNLFTSEEYLPFLPELAARPWDHVTVLDCGGGIGLFTLLIEHLLRLELLPWGSASYVLIEPSRFNLPRLRRNLAANLDPARYTLLEGLVGEREGEARFFESRRHRWGSNVFQAAGRGDRASRKPYIDVAPLLERGPCLAKLDVEGAEFRWIDNYQRLLANVFALVVEWHPEFGDVAAAERTLASAGLPRARGVRPGNRKVDLYARPRPDHGPT